ncbi:MAG: DUF4062 domain-containing protein [Betaproteobacteria bacterium]|nr:DUF4062 domain-containing protein [Betaproteobacteria bacterium]
MKIFVSSLISGFEPFREAAKSAIATLRHEAVMAEDFGARPNTPQVACLQAVRSADLVVLLVGARYGYPQGSSALSPTHEEYIEARDTKPILVFVQDEVERESEQVKFLSGVQAWQTGHFREAFKTPEQLKDLVTRAIHDYQLSHSAAPLDVAALVETATSSPSHAAEQPLRSPMLSMAFVGGPFQRVLRPTQLEEPSVAKAMHKQALFGEPGVFDGTKGVDIGINDAALVLAQVGGARIQVDEHGSLVMHSRWSESNNGPGQGSAALRSSRRSSSAN